MTSNTSGLLWASSAQSSNSMFGSRWKTIEWEERGPPGTNRFNGGYPSGWCAGQTFWFRLTFGRSGPTEPAGKPSLRGRPTGRLILGRGGGPPSKFFFELPFGRPGRRLAGSAGLSFADSAAPSAAACGAPTTWPTSGLSLATTWAESELALSLSICYCKNKHLFQHFVNPNEKTSNKIQAYLRATQHDFRMAFDYFPSPRMVAAAEHWRYL